jgi:hypothetical protein
MAGAIGNVCVPAEIIAGYVGTCCGLKSHDLADAFALKLAVIFDMGRPAVTALAGMARHANI